MRERHWTLRCRRMALTTTLTVASTVVASLFAVVPAAAAQPAPEPDLFAPVRMEDCLACQASAATEPDGPGPPRRRFARIDRETLEAARQAAARRDGEPAGAAIRLNLFPDMALRAVVESTGATSSGYWLSGRLEGPDGSPVGALTLVVNGDVAAGSVYAPDGTYSIRSVGDGVHAIRPIVPLDPGRLEPPYPRPPEDEPALFGVAPPADAGREQAPGRELALRAAPDAASEAEDGSRIDVLAVYTSSAMREAGGRAAIEALIELAAAETNQAFANSGVVPRIRVVGMERVEYRVQESHACVVCLLREPSDGVLDEVHGMRDERAADLVSLFVADPFPYGGEASVARNLPSAEAAEVHAWSIVHVRWAVPLFAHEIGHLMGAEHERYAEVNACCAARQGRSLAAGSIPYRYGYVNRRAFQPDAPAESRWRTIMAYGTQCEDAGFDCRGLPRFSNPEQTWMGDPLGVPGSLPSADLNGPADVSRTLNRTRRMVANYRVAPVPDDDGGNVGTGAEITSAAKCEDGLCGARSDAAVTFEDTSASGVTARLWDFGDGTQSERRVVSHAWSSPGFYRVTLTVWRGDEEWTTSMKFLVEASEPAGTCVADGHTRCLADSRYAVTVDWFPANGEGGAANVAREGTNDSALFYFFDADNWEILVKVLDGCTQGDHVWVYGASTTDLGYVIRVADTATGTVKEYRNEPGMPAPALTDAKAFPACAP